VCRQYVHARLIDVNILFGIAVLVQQPVWTSSKPWVDYVAKVQGAYSIEVRWTSKKGSGLAEEWRLVRFGKDRILLERRGENRVIWNRDRGIELNLKDRKYKKLANKPDFEPAAYLRIPGVIVQKEAVYPWPNREVSQKRGDILWTGLEVKRNEIDFGAVYTYWFDPKNRLVAIYDILEIPKGDRFRKQVHYFDLTALPDPSEFVVDPPKGFTPA
jgi:hypothetical protein